MHEKEHWLHLYRTMAIPALPDIVTGFNVALDCTIPVNPALLRSPALDRPEFAEFSARQIAALKKANPAIRIHIECVTTRDPSVLDGMIRHILPQADSAGMNEYELAIMLGHVRSNDTARVDNGFSSPPPVLCREPSNWQKRLRFTGSTSTRTVTTCS